MEPSEEWVDYENHQEEVEKRKQMPTRADLS